MKYCSQFKLKHLFTSFHTHSTFEKTYLHYHLTVSSSDIFLLIICFDPIKYIFKQILFSIRFISFIAKNFHLLLGFELQHGLALINPINTKSNFLQLHRFQYFHAFFELSRITSNVFFIIPVWRA